MSSDGVQEVLASFDAFNAHNLDGAVGPLVDDCVWTEHPTGITHQGTQQIKDWFAGFWAAFPDLAVLTRPARTVWCPGRSGVAVDRDVTPRWGRRSGVRPVSRP